MKFFGYYVNGVCYGCTTTAKAKAEKAAKEQGVKVECRSYKI